MIKTLQRKISIMLTILLGIVWVLGVAALNWINYMNQVTRLRSEVRTEIEHTGWHKFLRTGGESEDYDFEDLDYSIFQLKKDSSITILSNHFSDMTEEEIMDYAAELSQHWWAGKWFWKVTYLNRYDRTYGRCLVLISSKEAVSDALPFLAVSIVVMISGIFLLFAATRKLSVWLVCPVEEFIQSEQKFMTNASHELKTPLTVLRTNVELLSDEIGENKHLRYIGMETERMVSLVNKMLTLVRLDSHYTEQNNKKFCLDEALLNVVYPMESVAYEKKIHMEFHIKEQMWFVGNEEQLQSVMSILLDNAISYTPEGGRIEIHADIHSKKFYLAIANTGENIPEEQREKLFERFYRQDEARESASNHLGLGLSIAENIVSKHHGKIWVESVDGKNIFHVTLPCVKK